MIYSMYRSGCMIKPRTKPESDSIEPTWITLSLTFCHLVNNTVHGFNPLSPKSDQHQISPCTINACKTEWSWELRKWSPKMNLLDILSTSPHYFCRKWIGATYENSNFGLRVNQLSLIQVFFMVIITWLIHERMLPPLYVI